MVDATSVARVISPEMWGPELSLIHGVGTCREIVGPRIGATLRSLYHVDLGPLSSTISLKHPDEAVYYVIRGEIEVSSSTTKSETVREGGMFHVGPFADYAMYTTTGALIVGGPSPVDPLFGTPSSSLATPPNAKDPAVTFYHRDRPGLMVPMISADARLVVWYGVGAVNANMNYVVLEPGERNTEHVHRYSEDTIFILAGRGTAEDMTNDRKLDFGPGDTVSIPPGVVHAISADRGDRVVSAGGPCPADLDMLFAAGVDVDALTEALAEP